MTFWVLYDHLGHFIVLNLLTVVLVMALGLLFDGLGWSPILMVGPVVLLLFVLSGGQGHLVNTLLSGQPFDYRTFLTGLRRFGVPLALSGLAVGGAIALCGLGVYFYGAVLAVRAPWVGLALAQLCACTGVGLAMVAFHVVPAVLAHHGALWPAWRSSVKIVLRHPVGSTVLLMAALLAVVVAVTPPGFVLLSTLPLVTLACCAYELYARAYAATETVCDEADEYLNRGFRDFLCPWKE